MLYPSRSIIELERIIVQLRHQHGLLNCVNYKIGLTPSGCATVIICSSCELNMAFLSSPSSTIVAS